MAPAKYLHKRKGGEVIAATNICSDFGGFRIGGRRSCDPKDTPFSPMDPPSPGDSPGNFKKLVNVYISLPLHFQYHTSPQSSPIVHGYQNIS